MWEFLKLQPGKLYKIKGVGSKTVDEIRAKQERLRRFGKAIGVPRSQTILGRMSNRVAWSVAKRHNEQGQTFCFTALAYDTTDGRKMYADRTYVGPRDRYKPKQRKQLGDGRMRYNVIVTPHP